MATWEVKYASDSATYLTVTATESDVNIANNTSKVTVKVELVSKTTYTAWNGNSQNLSVKVDGSTIGSRTFTYNLAGNTRVTLGTYSKTVTHNSDGSKTSAIAVSASGGGDSGSISQNLGLTTIARATTPTLSASSVNLGSAITINLPRASSSFTHDIRYDFAGLTGQTSGIATSNGATTSTTFTPPASLASRIPNSTSNGGVLSVTTKNGTTVIGTKTINFTANIPNNATYNPTVGAPSVSEQNSTVSTGITGIWVQNHSKIRIIATASPKYSATVKSARISIGGAWRSAKVSGNTITISSDYVPTVSGTHSYTVEITDSRERKATSTGSLTVTAYSKPRLVLSASRKPDNPLKIIVTAKATGSSLSAKNTMQMEVYSKASGATSWGTKLTLPTGKVESSTTGEIDWGTIEFGDYAETSSYEVRVRAQDELTGWAEAIIPISTTAVLFNAYKDMGISVGKMYEPAIGGALQISGDVYANNRKIINRDGNIEVHDTRSVNTSTDIGDKGVMFEFKSNGIDGLTDGGLYHGVMTFQQWSEVSGGLVHQLGFGYNSLWFRNATIGSTWNAWGEIPTADYGSNANGHYLKFGNGVLICFKSMHSVTAPMNIASGSLFRSGNLDWIFPHMFTSYSNVSVTGTTRVWSKWLTTNGNDYDRARFVQWGTATSTTTEPMSVMAIGRWK